MDEDEVPINILLDEFFNKEYSYNLMHNLREERRPFVSFIFNHWNRLIQIDFKYHTVASTIFTTFLLDVVVSFYSGDSRLCIKIYIDSDYNHELDVKSLEWSSVNNIHEEVVKIIHNHIKEVTKFS